MENVCLKIKSDAYDYRSDDKTVRLIHSTDKSITHYRFCKQSDQLEVNGEKRDASFAAQFSNHLRVLMNDLDHGRATIEEE